MNSPEWFTNSKGQIDRACPHNAYMAINALPHGYAELAILSRTKNSMRHLADFIALQHGYRPTLKAMWEAVNNIRDQVFGTAKDVLFRTVDGRKLHMPGKWLCQEAECPLGNEGTTGGQLYFVQGSWLCRKCSPPEELRKRPVTLTSARHEMRLRGMLE